MFQEDERISQRTIDLIEQFCKMWPDAEFGPAHLVLSDYNVDDSDLNFCLSWTLVAAFHRLEWDHLLEDPLCSYNLDTVLDAVKKHDWYADHSLQELDATIFFLSDLLDVPEDER